MAGRNKLQTARNTAINALTRALFPRFHFPRRGLPVTTTTAYHLRYYLSNITSLVLLLNSK